MIQESLQSYYDFLTTDKFAELELLGVFAYGSMNYGYYKEGVSDIDAYVIIFPKFKTLYFNNKINKEYQINKNNKLFFLDIRSFVEDIISQKMSALQLLYTDYKVINPKYEEAFKEIFYNHRNKYTKINPKSLVMRLIGHGIYHLEKKERTAKDIYNGVRLLNSALDYINGLPFEEVLCTKNINTHNWLYDIKYNKKKEEELDKIAKTTLEQLKKLQETVLNNSNLLPIEESNATIQFIQDEVFNLIKSNVTKELSNKTITASEFLDSLTMLEKKAFESVKTKIGTCGGVSISKLIEETGISRTVYSSLFNKMTKAEVAEITNGGVKGTYIKIVIPSL